MFEHITGAHKPDILDCISNLSSDEVFTPPDVVNQVLDLLPGEVWTNPELKFLDPACKSGVFLREAAKRLLDGLQDAIPEEDKRREHIFKNMLYGIAITELTGLISRRSLYYSKDASGKHSVLMLDTPEGNIHYSRGKHRYVQKKCIVCGAPFGELDRGKHLENYAYQFLHHKNIQEIFDMNFDVIIGNPPYQLQDAGNSTGASPIYHRFIEKAKKLNPRYISMIIPSRWFVGGKGLDTFRKRMLEDTHISHLVDYLNAADCFPGVEVKGGICYFLWNAKHNGECSIRTIIDGVSDDPVKRRLNQFDVFVRFNKAVSVIDRVQSKSDSWFDSIVSRQKPFGFRTNFKAFGASKEQLSDPIHIFGNKSEGWIERDRIAVNTAWISKPKVLVSAAYNGGDGWPHQIINKPFTVPGRTCCTETYIVIGPFDTVQHARNAEQYMKTKFFRFMVAMKKITQHNPRDRFTFVPLLDLDRAWTDSDLYKYFGLNSSEIQFIETMVREMP